MAIQVNKKGKSHAMALVNSGKIDKGDSWSFSAEDGNKLLGEKGDDWAEYAKWFFAEDTSAREETKDRYKYPFGKAGKVFRKGVIAAKQWAAQQDETEIADAADAVLQKIDKAEKMAEFTYNEKRSAIEDAMRPAKDTPGPRVQEMYDDRAIINDKGSLYEMPYTLDEKGAVTLGTRTPVKVSYEKLGELLNVEVYKTGTHTSESGAKLNVTEKNLEEILNNFHELKKTLPQRPPMVVSHAEGDAGTAITVMTMGTPVIGWMKDLRKTGGSLFADFSDIPEKAKDLIGKGLKRISPEIYTNFQYNGKAYGQAIRRVAFVPVSSIKDLADVQFDQLAFGEASKQPAAWVILDEEGPKLTGKETQEMLDLLKLQEQVSKLSERITMLESENSILKNEKAQAVTKLSEAQALQKKDEIHRFCEGQKKDGKLVPAMQESGIERFMESLENQKVLKFGEEDKAVELSQLNWFTNFLGKFGKIIHFGEVESGSEEDKAAQEKTTAAMIAKGAPRPKNMKK